MKEISNELKRIVKLVGPQLRAISSEPDLAIRPRPDKWSRKEILGHLIDSACNNQQKFVRMMYQSPLEFPGYAQDDWVLLQKWESADWENMIILWESYNSHLAHLIEQTDAGLCENSITIDGVGPFTLGFVVPDYVEHLKHHVKQIFPDINLESNFQNIYKA